MKHFAIALVLLCASTSAFPQSLAPLGSNLAKYYGTMSENEQIPVWVTFKDKGAAAEQMMTMSPEAFLTPRAIERRQRMLAAQPTDASSVIAMEDIPLDRSYVASVSGIASKVRHEVKWFNAMSVVAAKSQIEAMRALPQVKEIELVARIRVRGLEPVSVLDKGLPPQIQGPQTQPLLNYGTSLGQNQQINVVALHNQNINGAGVLVAVFDAGFSNLTHPALSTRPIIARYDFSTNSTTLGSHSHGQNTFSVVGGFSEGNLIGPAYGATFALARTEVDPTETPTEEDNWARAAIWADSLGVDVISCSLGYIGFDSPYPGYTWQSMNGNTTTITRAANRATQLGIVVVNSAGNEGDPGGNINSLGAPADGFDVIAAGAVGSSGSRVSFSSTGPSADGRIKPDVMAQGSSTWAATGSSSYGGVSGTSFSCPLTAGAAALVLSANLSAGLTPKQVAEALRQTASRANNPDRLMGWGIVNTAKAAHYVWIEHTSPGNTSDTIARQITVRLKSRIPFLADSTRIWYGVNGVISGSAPLSQMGSTTSYRASIPFLGRNVNVTYYVRAKNDSVAVRSPLGTGFYSYQVNNDNAGPAITHTPRGNVAVTAWPPRLSAVVTDITNPIGVTLEYKLNGVAKSPIALTSPDSVYADTLNIARNTLRDNDLVEYRFKAMDLSGNISYSPSTDYHQFRVKNATHVENMFEVNNASFTATNDWEYGVRGGASPAPNSGTKYWATKLASNYTTGPKLSSLTTPAYNVYSNRATFSFYNWFEAESRFDGGNVKASVNGGAFQLLTPVGGYPIESILGTFSNPLAGQPGYANTSGSQWKKQTFDLTGLASEGGTIAIRFDFGSGSDTRTYRGWYIDDFVSDGFGTGGPLDVNNQPELPKKFSLEQNYPNPFNPSTRIAFTIQVSGFTSLKVYDVLGREVATLVDGPMAAGTHGVVLEANRLSSGTYFYKLQSGSNTSVKKLMLVK
ncbi:MAG: S8 family serine peptidase [Ignavibacteriae bacterium]|nr:S8 family serine peptidase [Ignavibacteriota bacterium]